MSNSAATATEGPDRTGGPLHVAIIMDGNGRWAAARGLPRAEGHRRGVDALRRVVRAASEAFRLSEQRLREGTIDLVTVLTTQQTLFQAQDTLAQVRLSRLQAVVGLYQALGGGWTPDGKLASVQTPEQTPEVPQ